jgi:hypothetical protein
MSINQFTRLRRLLLTPLLQKDEKRISRQLIDQKGINQQGFLWKDGVTQLSNT